MGFGKYTTDERKIVYKISDLMSKLSYHRRKSIEFSKGIKELIDQLGSKYEVKNHNEI